jgi:hypothetical protein
MVVTSCFVRIAVAWVPGTTRARRNPCSGRDAISSADVIGLQCNK